MVKDDVLKLRKSDDHCTNAEKQHRAQTSATVVKCSQRRWVEYDFGLVPIISPMKNSRALPRLECAIVLYVHRSELFLFGITDSIVEDSGKFLVKIMQKQCVDATIWTRLMIWKLPRSAVVP